MFANRVWTAVLVLMLAAGCGGPSGKDAGDAESARESIEENANNPEALHGMARAAWWKENNLDLAAQLYLRVTKLDEGNAAAHFELGQVLGLRGLYPQSASHLGAFIGMAGEDDAQAAESVRNFLAQYKAVAVPPDERQPEGWRAEGNRAANSIGMEFVLAPQGEFTMGLDTGTPEERPAHTVELNPYWIGVHEVTVGQFKQFIEETGIGYDMARSENVAPGDNYPMPGVPWAMARLFTIWLSTRESANYRLPSEAEWERAARGLDGRGNPWGHERSEPGVNANVGRADMPGEVSGPPLMPVDALPEGASPLGCLHMAGNVAEWCLDQFHPAFYAISPKTNPFGPARPEGTEGRSLRGGGWSTAPTIYHAINRTGENPKAIRMDVGFRVVREAPEALKPPE